MVIALTHVVLLLLISAEYADFAQVRIQKAAEDGIAERTGATGNE